ncbi:MAG: phosphatase PAP2 family protein [Thermodesulfobacteriota bacterium]
MRWELLFIQWANGWWSLPILDSFLPWLTYLGSHFAVILFILLSLIFTQQRVVFRHLLILYGIQSGVIYALKFLIQRERPLFILEIAYKISEGPGEILDTSFPSAHAGFSFMMATLLSTWFPRKSIFFYLLAAFISWTRIYLGLHFPTDILAGAFLGYSLTKGYIKIFDKKFPICKK